jgi:predicted acetyltransferase
VTTQIRPVGPGEFDGFVATLELIAGRQPSEEVLEDARAAIDPGRTLAVFEEDTMIAGTSWDVLELTVPGPVVLPAARLMQAGVLPTHRHQGVMTQLLVREAVDIGRAGLPLAMFTTTGPGIYRRIGYGPATTSVELEVETVHAALDVPIGTEGRMRVIGGEEAARTVRDVFERHRRLQPGQVLRTDAFWRVWGVDRPRYRRSDASERFVAVYETDGGADGYVTYRLGYGSPRDDPVRTFLVEDLVAVTDVARRSLWAFCLGFRQAARVVAENVPPDDPVRWMLADPRRLRLLRAREFLWVRLADVATALSARAYGAADTLVFDVRDSVWPENARRFRLVAAAEEAECAPTGEEADLALDVADLSSAYLGDVAFATLSRAGRVEERSAGAIARADALFAWRPAPWTVADW